MPDVKANWYQPVVELGDDDPFAVEQTGVRIDLDERAPLAHELVAHVREIQRLNGAGVRCPILTLPDTSCHACPISEHAQPSTKGQLCRAGRALEATCTRLAVIEDGQ